MPGGETLDQALNRAVQAAQARRVNEAKGICQDVLAVAPENPGALGLLGSVIGRAGGLDEAVGYLERAVARKPDVASWHGNLCALYRAIHRLDDAIHAGREAVRLQPDNANHYVELGLAHLTRGELDIAQACFLTGLGRDGENANAHMALGELLLARGQFRPGWLEYEWRNKLEQARGLLPRMVAAPWNGMTLPRGRILLVADQGFGDMIQFARYIPRVAERCDEVVVGWGPDVMALLNRLPGVSGTFLRWADAPRHDAYCLLSSLPGLFGTELETIPAPIPYLSAEPGRVRHWAEWLAARCGPGPRVGLAWSGRPTHPNNARRTLALAQLAPLLDVPGVQFVSIQKPAPEADRALLASLPNVVDASPDLADFGETAALLTQLDLLIAVDTAVVHLAGALGRPVWVLLPTPADWRWLTGREDSPWYPSVRLFRQTKPHDWEPVIRRAAEALRARVA